jgi:hypothetical protein
LYCTKAEDLADGFRSKMVEADILACLVGLLQDGVATVRITSIKAITALAEFGRLIYHFLLCED